MRTITMSVNELMTKFDKDQALHDLTISDIVWAFGCTLESWQIAISVDDDSITLCGDVEPERSLSRQQPTTSY